MHFSLVCCYVMCLRVSSHQKFALQTIYRGTALWFWLFKKPPGEDTTCHIQALEGSFGSTLNIINGGLECPPDPNGYHAEAIVTRLRYYCIAASVIGVKRLLDFDGCEGLQKSFEECIMVCTNLMFSLLCFGLHSADKDITLPTRLGTAPNVRIGTLIRGTKIQSQPKNLHQQSQPHLLCHSDRGPMIHG